MKSALSVLLTLVFLLSVRCFAQYPQWAAFKNDSELSGPDGFFKDSAVNPFLYKMREPVLSNYYLSKDIYRFTLSPSLLSAAMIIKIERTGNNISIETKEAQITETPRDSQVYEIYAFTINKTKPLDSNRYNALLRLVDTLFTHRLSAYRPGNDGSDWIFEMSTKDGYFYERKWSPIKGDPMKSIGTLMIDLSDLKHKKFAKKL
jgi:hypothetical protein